MKRATEWLRQIFWLLHDESADIWIHFKCHSTINYETVEFHTYDSTWGTSNCASKLSDTNTRGAIPSGNWPRSSDLKRKIPFEWDQSPVGWNRLKSYDRSRMQWTPFSPFPCWGNSRTYTNDYARPFRRTTTYPVDKRPYTYSCWRELRRQLLLLIWSMRSWVEPDTWMGHYWQY
jgi:hypothetical protein